MDCGFGEGAVAGVWRRRDRKEVFPYTAAEMTYILGPSPVSVFRGQLCPGREGPWDPLACIPRSPQYLKSWVLKHVASWEHGSPWVDKWPA